MTISEVARRVGLRPSAIRYYERLGILLPAERVSGRRRYDATVLYRLAVVQHARKTGFTLDEIRELFFGFRQTATASQRWKKLSVRKLEELEHLTTQIKTMRHVLRRMIQCCHCDTLDQCGRGILRSGLPQGSVHSLPGTYRTARRPGRVS